MPNSDSVDDIISSVVMSDQFMDAEEKLARLLPIADENHHQMQWAWFTIAIAALQIGDDDLFFKFSERFCLGDKAQRFEARVGKLYLLQNRILKLRDRGEPVQRDVAEFLAQSPAQKDHDWLRQHGIEALTADLSVFPADAQFEFSEAPAHGGVVQPPITYPHFAVTTPRRIKPVISVVEHVEYLAAHEEAAAVRSGPSFYTGLSRSDGLATTRRDLLAGGGEPIRLGGTAVVLSDVFLDSNYCHWMCEWFPRFLLAREMVGEIDYVCTRMKGSSFQVETLTEIGGLKEHQILRDKPASWYAFDRLISVDNRPVADTHPVWGANPSVIDLVRRTVLDKASPTAPGARRLYVTRADAGTRVVVNEDALLALLSRYDVQTISLTGLSVTQQAAALANCEFLISPHGAGLTNMMFMPPGGVVVELFHYQAGSITYPRLAQGCGHRYFYMSCDSIPDSADLAINRPEAQNQRFHYHDVWVDTEILARTLAEIFPDG